MKTQPIIAQSDCGAGELVVSYDRLTGRGIVRKRGLVRLVVQWEGDGLAVRHNGGLPLSDIKAVEFAVRIENQS